MVENSFEVYRFGSFRLDVGAQRLTYDGEDVPLSDRLFRIMVSLVRANGAVVSRDCLYGLVWPNGEVPENNLSQHIYLLRCRLAEFDADRIYIGTVHKKGFRFVPPVLFATELFAETIGLDQAEFVPALAQLIRTHLISSGAA